MNQQQINEILSEFPLNQFGEIEKELLLFDDEVREGCARNYCGSYGKTWMCPPGVGSIAEWKETMLAYDHPVLFNYVGKIEDSFDFEGMTQIAVEFKKIVTEIRDKLRESGVDFRIFGAGGCQLCPKCSYPDAPCRQPDKVIPSVESCGLFIAKMAEPCGFQYINGANTVTYFGLVLY